jgi:hypothetical protein
VKTHDYVATPTLGDRQSRGLFAIAKLGRFGATCLGAGRAEVFYRAARGTATQLVTTQSRLSSKSLLDPGQRVAVSIGGATGPRIDWQIALFSAGAIKVATASFTVGPLAGAHGCLVSGKGESAERPRDTAR